MAKERKPQLAAPGKIKVNPEEPFLVVAKRGAGCEVESGARKEDLPLLGKYALLHILDTLIEQNEDPRLDPRRLAARELQAMAEAVLARIEKKYAQGGPQGMLH